MQKNMQTKDANAGRHAIVIENPGEELLMRHPLLQTCYSGLCRAHEWQRIFCKVQNDRPIDLDSAGGIVFVVSADAGLHCENE